MYSVWGIKFSIEGPTSRARFYGPDGLEMVSEGHTSRRRVTRYRVNVYGEGNEILCYHLVGRPKTGFYHFSPPLVRKSNHVWCNVSPLYLRESDYRPGNWWCYYLKTLTYFHKCFKDHRRRQDHERENDSKQLTIYFIYFSSRVVFRDGYRDSSYSNDKSRRRHEFRET